MFVLCKQFTKLIIQIIAIKYENMPLIGHNPKQPTASCTHSNFYT